MSKLVSLTNMLISVLIVFFPSELLSAFNDIEQELKVAIVVIADQNNKPIGTGTFINSKGLIITAKHVVEDSIEGTQADSYFIRTSYRLSNSNKFYGADLVAVHPYLDVAILKAIETENEIKPVKIGSAKKLDKKDDKLYLFGHKSIPSLEITDLYKSLTANINDLDHNGYIKVSQGGSSGMSGGPVFNSDGKLIGIIRDVESSESTVVPIDSVIDDFKILGIHFDLDTHVRESNTITELYDKIDDLERMALDLQSNLRWTVTPMISYKRSGRCEFGLKFNYSKSFVTQPDLDNTLFYLEINPYIKGVDQVKPEDLSLKDKEWFLSENKSVTFRNILLSIEDKIKHNQELLNNKEINIEKSLELIIANITFTIPHKRSSRGIEIKRKVCFTIPFKNNKDFEEGKIYEGLNCEMDQIE